MLARFFRHLRNAPPAELYEPREFRREEMPGLGVSLFTVLVPVLLMLAGGLWSTAVNLGLFAWAIHSGRGIQEAMTMTFVSLVLIQFCKAYNFRSDRRSLLERPFANRWLNLAILWEVALLLGIIYLPTLQEPFTTFALTATDWLIVLAMAVSVVPILEGVKWLARSGRLGATD